MRFDVDVQSSSNVSKTCDMVIRLHTFCVNCWSILSIVYTVIVVFCVIFLVVDTWDNPYRLVPLAGLAVYIIVCILFSSNPAKVT